MRTNGSAKRPLIGLTTFQRDIGKQRQVIVSGLGQTYIRAVEMAGGIPVLIPCGLSDEDNQAIFDRLDGVLLPGGGDIDPVLYGGIEHETVYGISPERDKTELWMANEAVNKSKPVFAICRGHQVFNVALGGTLWEDIPTLMPNGKKHAFHVGYPRNYLAHTVDVFADTHLSRYLGVGDIGTNSLHHQGVKKLAPDMIATAVSPDGVVEGIEVPGHPFAIGVQWHPELLVDDDPKMLALFEGLVDAARINL